jgi:hypothetical protein
MGAVLVKSLTNNGSGSRRIAAGFFLWCGKKFHQVFLVKEFSTWIGIS